MERILEQANDIVARHGILLMVQDDAAAKVIQENIEWADKEIAKQNLQAAFDSFTFNLSAFNTKKAKQLNLENLPKGFQGE